MSNTFGLWHPIEFNRKKLEFNTTDIPPFEKDVLVSFYYRKNKPYVAVASLKHNYTYAMNPWNNVCNLNLTFPNIYAWMELPDSPYDNPDIWKSDKVLPTVGTNVMTYYIGYNGALKFTVAHLETSDSGHSHWYSISAGDRINVKYWLPFPKPFKNGSTENLYTPDVTIAPIPKVTWYSVEEHPLPDKDVGPLLVTISDGKKTYVSRQYYNHSCKLYGVLPPKNITAWMHYPDPKSIKDGTWFEIPGPLNPAPSKGIIVAHRIIRTGVICLSIERSAYYVDWEDVNKRQSNTMKAVAWKYLPEPYTGEDNDMRTVQISADDSPIKAAEDTTTSVTIESAVEHPSHYNIGKIEVIDAINEWKLDFNLGNAVKYIARAGHKDPDKTVEDLKKAIFYIQDTIKRLEDQ